MFFCAQLFAIRLEFLQLLFLWQQVPAAMAFEFGQVNVAFPIGGKLPHAREWAQISHQSGQDMCAKRQIVHASTKLRGQLANAHNAAKKYIFSCMSGDCKIVKYTHCSRTHAILVICADPYCVAITCSQLDGDQVQIEACSSDKEPMWKTTTGSDADATISDVCKDITEAIVSKNAATRQS